jgi:N-methylhydantoinase A
VTDANLVLGRLSPSGLLDGEMPLDLDGAARVLEEKIARPLGISLQAAAEGILSVVDANMIRGIRRVSVERGYDPREFILVPFGGAGPMHGVELARALNMKEIVVPPHPGISSAVGMLSADVRHDYVQTHIAVPRNADIQRIRSIFEDMEAQGTEQLGREGFSGRSVVLVRSADMRYRRQSYELPVPVQGGVLDANDLTRITDDFHTLHEKAYGYARNAEAVEFVNLRVIALGKLPDFRAKRKASGAEKTAVSAGTREVWFAGQPVESPIYLRGRLPEGVEIRGPAIVEQMDSTIVIPPEYRAAADQYGNLTIREREKGNA